MRQSGNPKGRPPGARNKATLAVEALLEGEAEALTRKAVELAMEGNVVALRLCLDRLAPPRKDRTFVIDLPKLETAADLVLGQQEIAEAMAAGLISPHEAANMSSVLDRFGSALERQELEDRIDLLETVVAANQ